MSPAMMALEMVAMMVAMMLPSLAFTAWGVHRRLRAMRVPRAAQRIALLSIGYASVWSVIGLALFVSDMALSPTRMALSAESRGAAWTVGAVMVCAGLVQRSRWKANQLLRCRREAVAVRAIGGSVMIALLDGYRLGAACALSCAAPMAVLIAAGLMDTRMTLVITAAISAERVAPGGARIARFTGAVALVVGSVMCLRAVSMVANAGHYPAGSSSRVISTMVRRKPALANRRCAGSFRSAVDNTTCDEPPVRSDSSVAVNSWRPMPRPRNWGSTMMSWMTAAGPRSAM